MILYYGPGFAPASWRIRRAPEHLPKPPELTAKLIKPLKAWNVILLSQQFAKHSIFGGNNLHEASGRHELAIKKCAGLKLPKKNRVNIDDDITTPHIDRKRAALQPNPHNIKTEAGRSRAGACDQCDVLNGKAISKGYKGDLICLAEQ